MCAFSDVIIQTVRDEYISTHVETGRGWISLPNQMPELGPPWLIAFNDPTERDEEEYVSQYYRDADPVVSRSLHRSCNGMRLFGTRFQVPGVNFLSPDDKGPDFFNKPIDFDVTGGLVLPEKSPVNGFVIGSSHAPTEDEGLSVLWDIVDPAGCVVTGFFDTRTEIEQTFERLDGLENFARGVLFSAPKRAS